MKRVMINLKIVDFQHMDDRYILYEETKTNRTNIITHPTY